MNGVFNIFKPKGLSSHDIVREVRKILGIRKVGHTGTLDPNASGVLPICVGKATRTSEYLLDSNKIYIAELTLGYETDTQDEDGKILKQSDKIVSRTDIIRIFEFFKGEVYQLPPMYSALKYKGKKLYELAREGIEVERKKRKVYIYDMDILNIENNKILFRVKCSRGTYVRTLCNDIGKMLGTYGYMSYLMREEVYPFNIEEAISLETLFIKNANKEIEDILIPIDYGLRCFKSFDFPPYLWKKLSNGEKIKLNNLDIFKDIEIEENLRIYCKDTFIGIGKITNKNKELIFKMDKVLL